MGRITLGIAGAIWFGVVFLLTFWWTFPSQAIGDRVRVELFTATDGELDLQMQDLRPYWTGVAADNVVLLQNTPARGATAAEVNPLFVFDRARVRVSPFSLLGSTPRFAGDVTLGGSDVTYEVTAGMNKRGTNVVPRSVELSAPGMPIGDLAGLAGVQLNASGALDIDVDLQSEESMRDSVGKVRIAGRNLTIHEVDPSLTQGMDLGMEILLDEIEIELDIEDGQAEVRRGTITSPLAEVELEGSLTLRDDWARTTMDVVAKIELGEQLAMFKGFLKDAEQSDGTFAYRCSGSASRPRCRGERGRTSATRRSTGPVPVSGAATGARTTSGMTEEEKERRRAALQERVRAAAERRASVDNAREDEELLDDEEEFEEFEDEEGFEDERELDEEELTEEELDALEMEGP